MSILSNNEKLTLASDYAKKFNDNIKADQLERQCQEIADKVYIYLFSEYQLLLDMLPDALKTTCDRLQIRMNNKDYYLFMSEKRYISGVVEIEYNEYIAKLLTTHNKFKEECDYLQYQVRNHIREIYYKIVDYKSKKKLFNDFPELKPIGETNEQN